MTYILAATGLRSEARIVARPGVEVIACGGHGDVLAARLTERIAASRPAGLLSIGIAGALDSGLRVGDIVCDGDWTWLAGPTPGVARGVTGSATPAATPSAKAALHRSTRAHAVDMESHVAARVAAAQGLPFAALRVISDTAARDLPPAACVPLTPHGEVRLLAVLASVLRAPGQVGALLALARDTRAALAVLARCRITVA